METKFTPAPWVLRKTPARVSVIGANNETLFSEDKRMPCVMADATLIAAAPDLYAALLELHEAMGYMSEYDIPIGLPDRVRDALMKAGYTNDT